MTEGKPAVRADCGHPASAPATCVPSTGPLKARSGQRGVRGRAEAGRQREGPQGAAEWGLGAGVGGVPVCQDPAVGGSGGSAWGGRATKGRVGALSAVLAVGRPPGQRRQGRGANCVPKATRPNCGPAGQLPWQRGRGWGGV